ncbi:MAG: efflux RND transporter periplasmic adaptor subunit, partial [Synergistaceae bacterium]|nr:efflux RND transporter periplasmic adaptor subunit [Synergistaceae bacterium]
AVRVVRGEISSGVEEDGYLQPLEDRNFYATQTARITELPVEAGDEVSQGQLLIGMTNPDLEAILAETRAYWRQAEKSEIGYAAAAASLRLLLADENRNMERYRKLYEAGALSMTEMEQVSLRVERYTKDLAEAEARLGSASALSRGLRQQVLELEKKQAELTLKSPIDGYVLDLPVKKEQVVMAGELLVALGIEDEMEIRSDVLSDSLGGVKVGSRVRITAPILGSLTLEGHVKKIYPLAEEKVSPLGVAQRRVPVIIAFPMSEVLKPGYEVRVFIETSRREDVLLLPVESVRTEDGIRKVFQLQGGKIHATEVRIGITDRRMVEILEGLEEGDVVVRDASLDLSDGQRARAAEDI